MMRCGRGLPRLTWCDPEENPSEVCTTTIGTIVFHELRASSLVASTRAATENLRHVSARGETEMTD